MTETTWRKSTHSVPNGACLEADGPWAKATYSFSNSNCLEARWAKSSHSTCDGQCVEASHAGTVRVRDSKDPSGPVLVFAPAAWEAFTAGVKAGDLGRPAGGSR